jgi:hypothetical protein
VSALDYDSGFEETASWREDRMDGMIAYGVGLAASIERQIPARRRRVRSMDAPVRS